MVLNIGCGWMQRAGAMGRQPQLAGYDQLWGAYAGKQGLGAQANPALPGAGLKPNNSQLPNNLAANRFQPGLPTNQLPPDLQRAMLSQVHPCMHHHVMVQGMWCAMLCA